MRSIEYLVQLFPDKTGKEMLVIQAEDKAKDEKEFQERHNAKLKFIKDINTNGGYYRGIFGIEQHYFYRVFDLEMFDSGDVIMKVESIVIFVGNERGVIKGSKLSIERRLKDYEKLDTYGLEERERVTKKEWDEVNNYLDNITKKFW